MVGKIFVSYRRDDSASHALSIAQYLERAFGAQNVFIDVDRIRSGENFKTVLNERLTACKVVLAVIGPAWISSRDAAGKRRLDEPDDWVRLEIATALKRNITVIPILVGGASLPSVTELPGDLKPLASRQVAVVTTNGFRHEMAGLTGDVRAIVGHDYRRPLIIGGMALAALALIFAGFGFGIRVPEVSGNDSSGVARASFEVQLSGDCRKELQAWRSAAPIGAFAIASNGRCGSTSGKPKASTARTAALEACKTQGSDCRIAELNEGDWTLNADCLGQYNQWKTQPPAKVFAVSRSGHCVQLSDRVKFEEARSEAITTCERTGSECKVYDADAGNWEMRQVCNQDVVDWRKKEPTRTFAVARNGMCGSSWDHVTMEEARKAALQECEVVGSECRITEEYEGNWEVSEPCKKDLANWQGLRGRGAFAGGQSGVCGYSYSYSSRSEADNRALQECASNGGVNCKLLYQK